jgi:enediyne biosynthesis protein E4
VELNGLWQSIGAFDIDDDGDTDYVLGNWGLNSKFKASERAPMKMYYNDFDVNGQYETITVIEKGGSYYPLNGFDMLASQIPDLRKKYTNYESFAGKPIDEIFSNEQLEKSIVYKVYQLASGYLKNEGGEFKFASFPMELQISPIMAQLKYDFDSDGKQEVLLGGNYFGVQPFHGRYGSFSGAIIKSENKILNGKSMGLNFFNQSVRHLNIIPFKNSHYLLVTMNNGKAQVYKIK